MTTRRSHHQYKGRPAGSQEQPAPSGACRARGQAPDTVLGGERQPSDAFAGVRGPGAVAGPGAVKSPQGKGFGPATGAAPGLARRLRHSTSAATACVRTCVRALTPLEDYPKMSALSPETPKARPAKEIEPMIMDPKDKNRTVDLAIAQIEKQFGRGSIMKLGAKDFQQEIPVISTTSLSIDTALGIGGGPRGRVIEIFGPESS